MPAQDAQAQADQPHEVQDQERRSRLLAVQLAGLLREHLGDVTFADAPAFPPGAAAVVGREAWVLVDDRPRRSPADRPASQHLGSALAWARRRGAAALHVVVQADERMADAGILARRASQFTFPVSVWTAAGRALTPAGPEPLGAPPLPDPAHLALRELIAAGGATPHVEHGVVTGEVRGLEVCRVVDALDDPGHAESRGVRLAVGVGVHDREAFQLLHGDTPTVDSLSRVVDAVRAHRAVGAASHPFNRMSSERFLRWRLEEVPMTLGEAYGLRSVEPAQPPVARTSAVERVACVARGVDGSGRPTLLVCSVGVDLDVVPYAADARIAHVEEMGEAGVWRVVIVTPSRDRLPVTAELAGLLDQSVELASID